MLVLAWVAKEKVKSVKADNVEEFHYIFSFIISKMALNVHFVLYRDFICFL